MDLLAQATAILDAIAVYPDVKAEALDLRAQILRQTGRASEALRALDQALEVVESLGLHTGTISIDRAEFLRRYSRLFERMALWRVEAGADDLALEYAERGRARVLLDELVRHRFDFRAKIPSAQLAPLEAEEAELKLRLAEVQARLLPDAALPLRFKTSLELEEVQKEVDNLSRQLQEVRGQIELASPLLGRIPTPLSSLRMQQAAVPQDGFLLFYLIGERTSHLFLVPPPPQAIKAVALKVGPGAAALLGTTAGPLTAESLKALIQGGSNSTDLSDSIGLAELLGLSRKIVKSSPQAVAQLRRSALDLRLNSLFQILMPKAVWQQVEQARQVTIIPDGALHHLPFEALVVELDREPNSMKTTYWLDQGPVVTYAPSIGQLLSADRG